MKRSNKYPILKHILKDFHISLSNQEFDRLCGLYVRRTMNDAQIVRLIRIYSPMLKSEKKGPTPKYRPLTTDEREKIKQNLKDFRMGQI